MNKERLELMSTMLGEVVAKEWKFCPTAKIEGEPVTGEVRFDLWFWVLDSADCGFSACAVGHAMIDPRFNELGLGLLRNEPFYRDGTGVGHGHTGWEAVQAFFGVDEETASNLFSNHNYYDSETGDTMDRVPPEKVKWRVDKLLEIGADAFNKLVDDDISEIRELHK